MEDIHIGVLIGTLIFLVLLSAFFSASETGLMSLNRYRLRHLVRIKHPGAIRAEALLSRPDRLMGLVQIGNNFLNILASALATVAFTHMMGDAGIVIATGMMTILVLIFAEVAPKTMAALHPERVAFPAAYVLTPLLKLLYPLVWLTNLLSNGVLRLFGIKTGHNSHEQLTREELRTVVNEAGTLIPRRHQKMLLSILDLEKVTVEDIMVPRNEIIGIDLDEPGEKVLKQIARSEHTRLPVFNEDINSVTGFIHMRNLLQHEVDADSIKDIVQQVQREPYFVPAGTPLNTQLLNFQQQKRRMGLVVDEYGEIMGLVTLQDILEEIVGDFTLQSSAVVRDIFPQDDGSYIVDGTMNIRQLNKSMHWHLPTDGPKTLNGLIIEHLESIPEPGISVRIAGYPIEIIQAKDNMVRTARIYPEFRKEEEHHD